MKKLPSDNSDQFSDELVEDLGFIKKRLRYPFRRMTVMPFLAATLVLGFILRLLFVATLSKNSNSFMLLTLLLVCLPVAISLRRYIDLIRFTPIVTSLGLHDNIRLIAEFLQERHFLASRHPKAPEVFMIMSKNLSAITEEREILIFVADEQRILINSHFSSFRRRFRLVLSATHHKQIIREFDNWMQERSNPSTKVSSMRL